jgi:group I intron endonuclease
VKEIFCGIYGIRNLANGKLYIGYAKDIFGRWKRHIYDLVNNRHDNEHLQRAWNFYGEEYFEMFIVEECKECDLRKNERYFIKLLNTKSPNGYNLNDGGEGGLNPSEETRNKQREAGKGRKHSQEEKTKISEANKGKTFWNMTEEIRKKMSDVKKGKKHSEETKLKMALKSKGNTRPQGLAKGKTSKYCGVRKLKSGKYNARIVYCGKEIYLGNFYYELEAAIAYNNKAIELYGEKARLNVFSKEELEELDKQLNAKK